MVEGDDGEKSKAAPLRFEPRCFCDGHVRRQNQSFHIAERGFPFSDDVHGRIRYARENFERTAKVDLVLPGIDQATNREM
jgi:hypothetical protein